LKTPRRQESLFAFARLIAKAIKQPRRSKSKSDSRLRGNDEVRE
jgi:hypothetical protein